MNKYQKYLMNKNNSYIRYILKEKEIPCFNKDKITIDQDEDITVTKYDLYISNNAVDCAYAIQGDKVKKLIKSVDSDYSLSESGKQKRFSIKIDFNNRIDAIRICFVNNIADDLLIPIIYKEADKEKYYTKKEQEHKDKLLKTASIKVSTGADLVNIYFQPCCNKYDRTEILLYVPKDYVTVGSPYGPIEKPSTWSLIKKCKVPDEDFYISVSGLSYGEFAFILKQYDKNENIILETDYITFKILKPETPELGCLNII